MSTYTINISYTNVVALLFKDILCTKHLVNYMNPGVYAGMLKRGFHYIRVVTVLLEYLDLFAKGQCNTSVAIM